MNIIDLLGMLIALGAVLYSIVNTVLVIMNPKKYKKELSEEEVTPPVPPGVRQPMAPPEQYVFQAKMDTFTQETSIEGRELEIHIHPQEVRVEAEVGKKKRASIHALFTALPSKKALWIAHEVVSPPLSLRPSPLPWNK